MISHQSKKYFEKTEKGGFARIQIEQVTNNLYGSK